MDYQLRIIHYVRVISAIKTITCVAGDRFTPRYGKIRPPQIRCKAFKSPGPDHNITDYGSNFVNVENQLGSNICQIVTNIRCALATPLAAD